MKSYLLTMIAVHLLFVFFIFLLQNPEDQQAFYHAHMTGDEATNQNYHQEYFPETLMVLQNHVDYLVNELDEAYIRMEDHSVLASMDEGDVEDKNSNSHPRLPLISRHNNTVRGILELVKRYLDGIACS